MNTLNVHHQKINTLTAVYQIWIYTYSGDSSSEASGEHWAGEGAGQDEPEPEDAWRKYKH